MQQEFFLPRGVSNLNFKFKKWGSWVLTCRWIESNFANFVTRSDRSPRGYETDKVEPIIRQIAIASKKSALRKNVSDRAQVVSHCGA